MSVLAIIGHSLFAIAGWEIGRATYPRLRAVIAGRARIRRRLTEVRAG